MARFHFDAVNYGDLEAREVWFYQALGASPAMFRRKTGSGALYWLGHRDATGDLPRRRQDLQADRSAASAPKGHEDRWIETIPGEGWFVYFRIYGPQAAAFDGAWKPGDFEVIE